MRELILDAGPLYALFDARDAHHQACADLLLSYPGRLVVPELVICEVGHFIGRRLGVEAELELIANFADAGLAADPVAPSDWMRIGELITRYRGFPLGITDASVIACAERRGAHAVATLDRRHFAAVRPAHAEAFELLP